MPISTLCLVLSGLLWGTGGLIGALFGRAAGVSALAVAAYRLLAGGGLIVAFLTLTGRRPPTGRAARARITVIGLLSALFQGCYFAAIALTSVSLATLVTIGGTPVIVAGLASAGLPAALAIGPTAAAYTLYFRGLRQASASTAALLSPIEPLTAAVLAALVLGNQLSATGIAGAVLLLAAVVRTVRTATVRTG